MEILSANPLSKDAMKITAVAKYNSIACNKCTSSSTLYGHVASATKVPKSEMNKCLVDKST
jgi:hypothetical protein